MKKIAILALSVSALFSSGMSVESIVERAYENHPKFKTMESEIEALELKSKLSLKLENPKLSFGANGVMQEAPLSMDREPLQTLYISLSQKLEINDQREYNSKANLLDAKSRHYGLLDAKVELKRDIEILLLENILLEDKIELLLESINNLEALKEQLESSAVAMSSKMEQIFKADLLISKAYLRIDNLKKEMVTKKNRAKELSFGDIDNFFFLDGVQNSIPSKEIALESSYKILRAKYKVEQKKAQLAAKKASKIPNPTINIGYFVRENRDNFFGIGVSVPLLLQKREDMDIKRVDIEQRGADFEVENIKNSISYRYDILKSEMKNQEEQITRIEGEILPNIAKIRDLGIERIKSGDSSIEGFYLVENEYIDTRVVLLDKRFEIEKLKRELIALGGEI